MFKRRLQEWLEIKPRVSFIATALWVCGCGLALGGARVGSAAAGAVGSPEPVCVMLLLLLSLLVASVCCWLNRRCLSVFFLCSLLCGLAYTYARMYVHNADRERLLNRWGEATATVERCVPSSDNKRVHLYLRLEQFGNESLNSEPQVVAHTSAQSLPQQVRNWTKGQCHPRLELQCVIKKPAEAAFPWDFDEARYLERQGLIGAALLSKRQRMRLVGEEPVGQAEKFSLWTDGIRQRMVVMHRVVLGEESGDLLSSMVIGDKAVRPNQTIQQQFQALGLTHIIAASGFNLTIVTAVAWWSLRFLSRSSALTTGWCLLAICFFCVLAGFSASVERAALMCSFLLIATFCRRSAHLPSVIGLALFVTTVIEPVALLDVGLQLSYAATLCIALCATRCKNLLRELLRIPEAIAEIVAAVTLANASVLPLQMLYFWQVGELSLPANIAVSPFVPPITVLGFVSSACAAVGLFPSSLIGVGIDWVVKMPLWLMMRVIALFASNRWSVVSLGPPIAATVWLYYLCLCGMVSAICLTDKSAFRKQLWCGAVCLYTLAALALFIRVPLRCPTVVCCHDAALVIVPQQDSYLFGSTDNITMQRAIKYLAINNIHTVPVQFKGIWTAGRTTFQSQTQSSVFQLTPQGMRRVQNVQGLF